MREGGRREEEGEKERGESDLGRWVSAANTLFCACAWQPTHPCFCD